MAATADNPKDDKPVIVRVKRKASQFRLDALWLEINERPHKRPLIDFEKLSISESSSSKVEELKTKKILVQHVETMACSEVTADLPGSADSSIIKEKNLRKEDMHLRLTMKDQLLAKAKQKQEDLSKNARFEQIWKSRRGKKDDEALHEVCRLYDVVRVDTEEKSHDVQEEYRSRELEDHRMMSQYLPLLREVMPSAAEEIESDIHDYVFKTRLPNCCAALFTENVNLCAASSDGFVYDFYAVKNDVETVEESTANHFPFETYDSNDENNPRNDYPDDDEVETIASNDQSECESESDSSEEGETGSHVSREGEDLGRYEWSDGRDPFVEDDIYSGDDWELYDNDEKMFGEEDNGM
nr:RNA-directed DNA methylation 4 [Ipomoea batatas]